jgi:hypothetical protein
MGPGEQHVPKIGVLLRSLHDVKDTSLEHPRTSGTSFMVLFHGVGG